MKPILPFLAGFVAPLLASSVELQVLPHSVLHDERFHSRELTDNRISVWTDEPEKAAILAKEFGFPPPAAPLGKGQIFAIFLNDHVAEDLVQIVGNKIARSAFADYAESGLRFNHPMPKPGQKYSHLTAVLFTPSHHVSSLGIRAMSEGGQSLFK
jgi:hypothetical protein